MGKTAIDLLKHIKDVYDKILDDEELGKLVRNVANNAAGGNPSFDSGFEELCYSELIKWFKS